MKLINRNLVFKLIVLSGVLLGVGRSAFAEEGKGLKSLTDAESARLNKRTLRKIRPNAIGLARANEERKKKGLPAVTTSASAVSEIEVDDGQVMGIATTSDSAADASASIPQVDNSALPSFPPIQAQGHQGSCVAWSTTYYAMSHEVCLTLGCDNKTKGEKIFSPRWTYNLINGGADSGAQFSDAFTLMAQQGAATLAELPYNQDEYRGWDLNSEHWRTAINYRMSESTSMKISTDADMVLVKQVLANGHVVNFGTAFGSHQSTTIAVDPFKGERIVTYVNGNEGPHAMTIVGYDDHIWVDINGNGTVDIGETGAFKIANSHGTRYGNAGFAWFAYDAFRQKSTVPGFAPAGRTQLAQMGKVYLRTYTAYQPKLLGKITISHASRNHMWFLLGSSKLSEAGPATTVMPFALAGMGGPYAFDGSTKEIQASFYFDLSAYVPANGINQASYFLYPADGAAGSPLTVSSFQIVSPSNGNALDSAPYVPVVVDANWTALRIGKYIDIVAPSVPGRPTAAVTVSNSRTMVKAPSITLSWPASTDNVGVKLYNVYRNNVLIAQVTGTTLQDTAIVWGGHYAYQVSAVDTSNNASAKSLAALISP